MFPTRGNNTLDVILTNDRSVFSSVEPEIPVGSSDHCCVKFDIVLFCVNTNVATLSVIGVD